MPLQESGDCAEVLLVAVGTTESYSINQRFGCPGFFPRNVVRYAITSSISAGV